MTFSTRFRTRIFVASVGVTAVALVFVTVIIAWQMRNEERSLIERRLTDEALLIAELLSEAGPATSEQRLDDEADRLAQFIDSRVTLIAADGRVVGDSTLDGEALARLENHFDRPEVQLARERRLGVVQRYSTTVQGDMLYAAVPASHPRVAYVRVALPLTAVSRQLRVVGT